MHGKNLGMAKTLTLITQGFCCFLGLLLGGRGGGGAGRPPLYVLKTDTKITLNNVLIIFNFSALLDWHNDVIWRHYDVIWLNLLTIHISLKVDTKQKILKQSGQYYGPTTQWRIVQDMITSPDLNQIVNRFKLLSGNLHAKCERKIIFNTMDRTGMKNTILNLFSIEKMWLNSMDNHAARNRYSRKENKLSRHRYQLITEFFLNETGPDIIGWCICCVM